MESELLLNRAGALFFCTLHHVYRKEELESSLYIPGLGVYSMNNRGWWKMFTIGQKMGQAAELAAAQNLLSTFSIPCITTDSVEKNRLHLDTPPRTHHPIHQLIRVHV
jgi:hypothetical protein